MHNSIDGTAPIIFEAFEASAGSQDVLDSQNALLWEFPGRTCELSETRFFDEDFQDNLADFLEKASMDTLSRLVAHTRKAESVYSIQDTRFRTPLTNV